MTMNLEELNLFKKFYKENKQISSQIGCYPICSIKKQQFINKYSEPKDKSIVTELVNCVKHVSNIEFDSLIKELCNKYNEVKEDNDIYILIYIPNMGSGSGGRLYYEKSSFYVTHIAAKYLNYDYIIDITEKDIISLDYASVSKISNKIKSLNITEDKNIYLYFCDDCSYSGQQIMLIITKFMNSLKESICNPVNCFYSRFIIPFILDKQVYRFINHQSKITNSIKNNFNKRNLYLKIKKATNEYKNSIKINEYYNIFKEFVDIPIPIDIICLMDIFTLDKIFLIDLLPIIDILNKNNNMVKNTNDILEDITIEKFGYKNLIYFDHKFADKPAINHVVIPPIIKNYTDLTEIYVYPPAGYRQIIYKLNNIPIIFNDTKTFLELLISI